MCNALIIPATDLLILINETKGGEVFDGVMNARQWNIKYSLLGVLALTASACEHTVAYPRTDLTPIGQCMVYEGKGETTEYTVELGGGGDELILAIQGFHPNDTSPERIVEVRLNNDVRIKPERLTNDCVCGVSFGQSEELCGYISTYKAPLQRSWLEAASVSGLELLFELENGLVVSGPRVPAGQVTDFLSRH